jgi:hypothetical protein
MKVVNTEQCLMFFGDGCRWLSKATHACADPHACRSRGYRSKRFRWWPSACFLFPGGLNYNHDDQDNDMRFNWLRTWCFSLGPKSSNYCFLVCMIPSDFRLEVDWSCSIYQDIPRWEFREEIGLALPHTLAIMCKSLQQTEIALILTSIVTPKRTLTSQSMKPRDHKSIIGMRKHCEVHNDCLEKKQIPPIPPIPLRLQKSPATF